MENKSKLEPSENGKGKPKCPICKEDATLVCGSCQSVSYCCVDHQKKHWKLHQSSCVFFHIKDDPSEFTGAGKYCVASRDLKAGTIILEELPVFQMPSNSLDRCITCGINLPPKSGRNGSHSCPKCNWPVCGTACAELSLHATNECKVFVANRIPYPKIIADSALFELALYPALMWGYAVMVQNPQQWKEMKKMLESSHVKSGRIVFLNGSIHFPVKLEKIASASSHFPNITKEDENLVMGILDKLFRLTLTQGYSIFIQEESTVPGCDLSERHRSAAYVYKTARYFVHSCSPNCFWTVGTFPDFKMQIRTSVSVKKGEKLTVSRFIYKKDFSNGTQNRQKQFRLHFHFPCRCDLCLDPTEFGTYQSAVVCASCKKTDADVNSKLGYLLPIDPLNLADDAPWKCNSCEKMTAASKFCGKIEEISLDLQKISSAANMVSGGKVCEAFIEMYRNKLVHPNHWLIQLASKLIRIYQLYRIHLLNTEEFSGFEKLMRFLLDLKDKTVPGLIHERILIVHDLSSAMCRRLLSLFAQEEFYKGFLKKSREDLSSILMEFEKCQQYQNESLLYHKHNPNIGRGQAVDKQLITLRSDMKCTEKWKTLVVARLAQIGIQRLSLGIN